MGQLSWRLDRCESPLCTLATDDGTGSGVARTVYSINGGPEQVYSGPFAFATEDAQVTFASIDEADNHETTRTVSPKIDATPPITTASGADGLWHNSAVTVNFTATDNAGGSGMVGGQAKTEYAIDTGGWQTGTSCTVTGSGVHSVSYLSADVVGNTEATKTVTVKIDTTPPIVRASGVDALWHRYSVKVTLLGADSLSNVAKTQWHFPSRSTLILRRTESGS
jgi:large repetitive protein